MSASVARKESLASRFLSLTSGSEFVKLVQDEDPLVVECREILHQLPQDRTREQLKQLKTLFASSKVMRHVDSLEPVMEEEFYRSLVLQTFREKESYIFKQGDIGVCFYIVFSGTVEIRKATNPDNRLEASVCVLEPGDCFGERSLRVDTDKRSASAVAIDDNVEIVSITKEKYDQILKSATELDNSTKQSLGALDSSTYFKSDFDLLKDIFHKKPEDRKEPDLNFAVKYFKGVKFFSNFPFDIRKKLCKAMHFMSAWSNTALFEEGTLGHHFYVILTGEVEISIKTPDRKGELSDVVVARLKEGETFGEKALQDDKNEGVRKATAKTNTFVELLVLHRNDFQDMIAGFQKVSLAKNRELLESVSFFRSPGWDSITLDSMCSVMIDKQFSYNEVIYQQGSRAVEMFIVVRGECSMHKVFVNPATGKEVSVCVGYYGPQSILGCVEASAGKFHDINIRPVTATAKSPVLLLALSRFDIFHILSDEARESLQMHPSAELFHDPDDIALKSIYWEKYRAGLVDEIVSNRIRNYPQTALTGRRIDFPHKFEKIHTEGKPYAVDPVLFKLVSNGKRSKKKKGDVLGSLISLDGNKMMATSKSEPQLKLSAIDSRQVMDIDNVMDPPNTFQKRKTIRPSQTSTSQRSSTIKRLSQSTSQPILRELRETGKQQNVLQILWKPVHGAYLPFSVVGYGTYVSSRKATPDATRQKGNTAAAPSKNIKVAAFRVFGKFRSLDTSIEFFRDVCNHEREKNPPYDCSSFTIFKDDAITMELTNHDAKSENDIELKPAPDISKWISASRATSFNFHHRKDANGQRFACISVSREIIRLTETSSREIVNVSTYQCFPTAASAIRFSRSRTGHVLNAMKVHLLVVPLLAWIRIDELERYDHRRKGLERLVNTQMSSMKQAI